MRNVFWKISELETLIGGIFRWACNLDRDNGRDRACLSSVQHTWPLINQCKALLTFSGLWQLYYVPCIHSNILILDQQFCLNWSFHCPFKFKSILKMERHKTWKEQFSRGPCPDSLWKQEFYQTFWSIHAKKLFYSLFHSGEHLVGIPIICLFCIWLNLHHTVPTTVSSAETKFHVWQFVESRWREISRD